RHLLVQPPSPLRRRRPRRPRDRHARRAARPRARLEAARRVLQAENDNIDSVNHSLVYYIALKNAGVPVEMHLYAQGGHAFGLRRTALPITGWPQLVETCLRTIGIVAA